MYASSYELDAFHCVFRRLHRIRRLYHRSTNQRNHHMPLQRALLQAATLVQEILPGCSLVALVVARLPPQLCKGVQRSLCAKLLEKYGLTKH